MKKYSFCFDTDTLPVDTGCSDKGSDTIGAYNRLDIDTFERYYNDLDDGSPCLLYTSPSPRDTR